MRASSAIVLAAVLVTATTAASRVGTDVCYVREGGRWVGNPRGKPYGCGPPPADAPAADAAENVGSSDERATGLPAEWFARLWCGFPFVHGGALLLLLWVLEQLGTLERLPSTNEALEWLGPRYVDASRATWLMIHVATSLCLHAMALTLQWLGADATAIVSKRVAALQVDSDVMCVLHVLASSGYLWASYSFWELRVKQAEIQRRRVLHDSPDDHESNRRWVGGHIAGGRELRGTTAPAGRSNAAAMAALRRVSLVTTVGLDAS
eukprot:COSAG01_NODE_142_length_24198_cov_8.924893_2_plen_265_part_00